MKVYHAEVDPRQFAHHFDKKFDRHDCRFNSRKTIFRNKSRFIVFGFAPELPSDAILCRSRCPFGGSCKTKVATVTMNGTLTWPRIYDTSKNFESESCTGPDDDEVVCASSRCLNPPPEDCSSSLRDRLCGGIQIAIWL